MKPPFRKLNEEWITRYFLAPAIRLFQSIGFQHIPPSRVEPSPYARADIYIEMTL